MASLDKRAETLTNYIEQMIHVIMITQCNCLDDASANLSVQELKTIKFIGKKGSCIMRECADYLMLAVSTITSIMDKLVRKNIVSRKRSDEDRRIVEVELSETGREIFKMDNEHMKEFSKGILQALNEEEQEQLLKLLKKSSTGGAG